MSDDDLERAPGRPSAHRIAGLVLAGGRGRRFGRPKADAVVGGTSLVQRAIELLRPFCDEVVVAVRSDVPLPPLDARVVIDPDGEPSAMAGLLSGLEALDAPQVLVVACDLVVAPSLVERLLAASPGTAVAVDDHGAQPLCARYPRADAVVACRRLIDEGDLRVRRLVDVLAATPIPTHPGDLRNVNTWPDAFAASLDVPAPSPDAIERILALTRDVAHGTERVNGPVASFLAGLAAGRRSDEVEQVLDDAIAAARALLPAEPDPV